MGTSAKKCELEKDKARLKELLDDTDNRVDRWLELADDLLTFLEMAKDKFPVGTRETKRNILSALGGSNLLLKDRILNISLENALLPMQTVAKEVRAIHNRLEPLQTPINKRENERLYARHPILLPE